MLHRNLSGDPWDDERDELPRVCALHHDDLHDDGGSLHGVYALHHGDLDVRCVREHDE